MDIYKKQLSSNELILLYLKEMTNHNVDICKHILKIKKEIENKETMEFYIEKSKPSRPFRFVKLRMWPIKHDIKHIGSKNFIQDTRNNNINKNPKLKDKTKFINNCIIEKYQRTRLFDMYLNGYETHLNII